ncbi:MAG: molecular chaperone TorD family protein [Fimbriimonadaceae bacterium]|nr:molecular chaperone TorD family protein [Fimbriimonadaceae bacterium]
MKARPGTVPLEDSRLRDAVSRSELLKVLSAAFGYPSPERYGLLRDYCRRAAGPSPGRITRVRRALVAFVHAFEELDRDSYETEHLRVFSHICVADCNPCESSYTTRHIFQASQAIAALTGFYRTFGLDAGGERPDHVSVELEFLSYLRYRESVELADGRAPGARVFRRAQRRFLERHLGLWYRHFAALVRRKAATGPLVLLADLLEATVHSEAAQTRSALPNLSTDLPMPFAVSSGATPGRGGGVVGSRGVFGA